MKIALVAMNGIHVADPELLAFGLSLPGLLDRGRVIASLPSLALLTLAGMTGKEHQVHYLEVADQQACDAVPADFDLVAISTYSAQILQAYALSDRLRAQGVPVVIGGPHVTCLPDEAQKHCTSVAIGAGELVWPQILQDAQQGQLKPRYGARYDDFDLRQAPMPAYELLEPQKDNWNRLTVQTSRGCPHLCEFCAASVLFAAKYKQKPMEKVLAEIDNLCSIWKRPFIEFVDDNAMVERAWWKEFLPQLAKRNLRWFVETDISVGFDDELLQLMCAAGCRQVLVGLESPAAHGLDRLELRANWKLKSWARYVSAVHNIQAHGIRVIGGFILGLDGHKPDIFERVADFADLLELYDVQITVFTPFPGTPLYTRLENEGRLLEPENWNLCSLFDVNFRPTDMNVDELRKGFRNLGEILYSEEVTARRRSRFNETLKKARSGRYYAKGPAEHEEQESDTRDFLPLGGV